MAGYYYPREYARACSESKYHPKIKMERSSSEQDDSDRPSPVGHGIPIATVMTANENWRGKNDPAERRRIQNRLNQRAFRQRQRAGESPKQYRPRAGSAKAEDHDDEDDDSASSSSEDEDEADSPQSESDHPSPNAEGPSTSESSEAQSSSTTDAQTGLVWDELARIINRNFMQAAVQNAQHLGVNLQALQQGALVKTPRTANRQIPQALIPVEAQFQIAHDPIIDILPHARLRYNILHGIATGQVNAAEFSQRLRTSGSLEQVNGNWQRRGMVVWTDPHQTGSWELSEPFVRRWCFLLNNCEDLLAATNVWRGRRGERLFPLQFSAGQRCSS